MRRTIRITASPFNHFRTELLVSVSSTGTPLLLKWFSTFQVRVRQICEASHVWLYNGELIIDIVADLF